MAGRGEKRQRSRALHDSIIHRDLPAAHALIAAGVEVHPNDSEHGENTLLLAAQTGSAELVRELLRRGADVHARDEVYGYTALHHARWRKNPEVMQALLDAGADINAQDSEGQTVLYKAVEMGEDIRVIWLLAHGADPNTEWDGRTVLYLAEESGRQYLARQLLDAGADPERGWRDEPE